MDEQIILEFLWLVEDEIPHEKTSGVSNFARTSYYKAQCDLGVRPGRAFINAIRDTPYYDRLVGTPYDPIYSFGYGDVLRAIDYLTKK